MKMSHRTEHVSWLSYRHIMRHLVNIRAACIGHLTAAVTLCHVRGATSDTCRLCAQLLLIYTTSVANDAFGTRAGRTVILVYAAQVCVFPKP